jgi:hypothetical protein
MIEKVSDGNWLLRIMNTNGVVIYQTNINNPGMNSGVRLQAVGEVNSPQQLNDLGVSGILTLRWQMSNLIWSNWDGWTLGINDNPPYVIQGVLPDESNNVQIFGNNGNPVPPDAPCPE